MGERHGGRTWTPKHKGCLLSRAHSLLLPWSRLVAMAISPQVMTTPRALQTRRNGRFPAVVRGARYSFFAEVQPRLLLGPQPHPLALALEPRSVLGALIVAAAGHVVDLCLLGAADVRVPGAAPLCFFA